MNIDAAEKEASEVLHSLLSVERIEKPIQRFHGQMQQVVVIGSEVGKCVEQKQNDNEQQWNNAMQQPVFNSIEHTDNYQNNNWEETIALDVEQTLTQEQTLQLMQNTNNGNENSVKNFETSTKNNKSNLESNSVSCNSQLDDKSASSPNKKYIRKRYKRDLKPDKGEDLEDSAYEVRVRFESGCECQDDCCFKGLNAENVYKHRLNIAELTKEEHDMYLMGVTMACMADPGVTAKQRKRKRLRAQYVYQGRRVCLSAFLYLENCTLYQLKRIRKHVMTHGVAPRVHGNHGKKPHNVFPLDTYRHATEFLKNYIEKYTIGSNNCKAPILFPSEISRKTIHNFYRQAVMETAPGQKAMGYSTFRHFMKEQFPQVRFCKQDSGSNNSSSTNNSNNKHCNNNNNNNNSINVVGQLQQQSHQHQTNHQQQQVVSACISSDTNHNHSNSNTSAGCSNIIEEQQQQSISISTQSTPSNTLTTNNIAHTGCPVSVSGGTLLSSAQMATIPVILSDSKPELTPQQTAFIVTPVSQLVQPFQTEHAITVTPLANAAYALQPCRINYC